MWLMWIILAILLAAFIGLVVATCRQYKGCPGCMCLGQHEDDKSPTVEKTPAAESSTRHGNKDNRGCG